MYRCPASQVSRSSAALISAFSGYQNGLLPDPGGLWDQAASFVHGLSILAAEKNAIEELSRESRRSNN